MHENELYHHGIKGQRWGVRRFQNYDGTLTTKGKARELKSAGQYKRALNRIDQGLAEEGHYLRKSEAKADRLLKKDLKLQDKLERKSQQALEAGNYNKYLAIEKKSIKSIDRSNRAFDEVEKHKQYIEAGQKLSNRLMKEAKDKGYKIESKEVNRIANTGEYYMMAYVFGAPVSAARNAEYVRGHHYKVTKPKNEYKQA